MGHWNHRVVRRTYDQGKSQEVQGFYIHEAYYGIDGDNPAITVEPIAPCGESVEELRKDLHQMLRALDKPVLDYETREEIQAGFGASTQKAIDDAQIAHRKYQQDFQSRKFWTGMNVPYGEPYGEPRPALRPDPVPQADGFSESGTLPENVTWIGEIDGKKYPGLGKPKSGTPTDLPEGSH